MQPSEILLFGNAPKPVKCGRNCVIGGGVVLPEINFTLPAIEVNDKTWTKITKEYSDIINAVCQRAVELSSPGLVVEFELLPPMTLNPEWGAEITAILKSALDDFYKKEGLNSALRVTPIDLREIKRPPIMRSGDLLETTMRTFELCAEAGADLLSIESTGGKELFDEAIVQVDLAAILCSLGVLAVKDMQFLWQKITHICNQHKIIPAGDTACGFANTAMVLADRGFIPKTLAAVVRVVSVVRSLQAYNEGAQGPSKDCAYEGPYIKAITGVPISMEGKSSACAHLSSLGNIAASCCDLWSNESVQNIKLLGGYAPVVSMEQLIYDCRLMNEALKAGREAALNLQSLFISSDAFLDPQAYVLHPDIVQTISAKLEKCKNPLEMAFCAFDATVEVLRKALKNKHLNLSEKELKWLDLLSMQREILPENETAFVEQVIVSPAGEKFLVEEYQL